MTAITLHLESLNDIKFIEELAKKMQISYEKSENKSSYNPTFVTKIKKGQEDIKNGKGIKMTLDELKELCK